ncbi:MAG TPA: MBL fold metallo-hydrolase [Bosea sp. (in: a-proteobacteria)]|jgi:glyoxylase-like metal-dependent hydrolase (beta-lactamase superfamily II)|uniref:AidB family quorum-quenching N-acyl homoserine lactonase n=1 Tax=Bosea sp. (in: a-proteobacteria) TaxID=1871050 RepID=UPI002E13D977|nr:MBL fold metallo-hydrolase [Bosea sp. (in: a-proteobacteria)]
MDQPPRRFGRYDVSILHDGFFEAPSQVLTHTSGQATRRDAIARWGHPKIRIPVSAFLLQGPDGITLVDAGTGTAWGEAYGYARAALQHRGVEPGQVRRILITHLHGDHALGLVAGDKPYFPEAEIIVPAADLAFFGDEAKRATTPKDRQGGFDIAATLQQLYAGRLRSVDPGTVLPGIELIALPGHTHGHSGYLIGDATRSLLLWGDALHLSSLQAGDPDIGIVYDLDGAAAARTRRDILDRAASQGWIVSGGHIEGFATVGTRGNGFELMPD